MGIILVPFLLIAVSMFVYSAILIVKAFLNKRVLLKDIFPSLIISTVIYLLLFIDYKSSDSAYAFGSYFAFPFYMIFIPFIIGVFTTLIKHKYGLLLSKSCFISVILSGIFIIICNKYTLSLVDYLGILKTY